MILKLILGAVKYCAMAVAIWGVVAGWYHKAPPVILSTFEAGDVVPKALLNPPDQIACVFHSRALAERMALGNWRVFSDHVDCQPKREGPIQDQPFSFPAGVEWINPYDSDGPVFVFHRILADI